MDPKKYRAQYSADVDASESVSRGAGNATAAVRGKANMSPSGQSPTR